jgi:hypothetical protein
VRRGLYWLMLFLMLFSALSLPFLVTVIIFIVATFLLENFYIGIFIFFVMDAIYGFQTFQIGPFYGLVTISSIAAYLMITLIKEKTFINKR